MKCSKCGKEIASDSNFCEYCGVRIKKSHGRKPIWIMLVILFLLLVLVGFVLVSNFGNHSQATDEGKDSLEVVNDTIKLGNIKKDNGKDEKEQAQQQSKASVQKLRRTETTVQPAESKVPKGYVDLGLSSKTLWKTSNETGFYTYEEAVSQFGTRLPTNEQWKELLEECQWQWTGSGYKVTGNNGNNMTLPAAGCRYCNGSVYGVGSDGRYWSSTPNGSECAWSLGFGSDGAGVNGTVRCFGLSVRLVQD